MLTDLFKRSSLYALSLFLGRVTTLIIFLLLARKLSPAFCGDLILFFTLIQFFYFFTDFGLNQWYQKQSDHEDKIKLFNKIFYCRLLTILVSLTIATAFLIISRSFSFINSLFFLLALIVEELLSIIDGYYLERKQPIKVAAKILVRNIVIFAGLTVLYNNFNLESALFIYLIGIVSSLIILFPWRILSFSQKPSFFQTLYWLKQSFSFALLNFTSYFYARGDHLIIKYLAGSVSLGLYGSAYRYLEALSLIPNALFQNLFPLSAKKEGVGLNSLIRITVLMAGAGLVTMLALYFASDFLIIELIGKNYQQAVTPLKIFSLVLFMFFLNAPLTAVVQSSSYLKKFLPFGVLNTVLNLSLNIILIPISGISAAAWVMLFTEITGFIINLYFIRQLFRLNV